MKNLKAICIVICLLGFWSSSIAVESGNYRLLSISDSEKLILVSQIPSKTKYLLDAASAKITVNGKPAEFKELKTFSIIQVKMDLRKNSKSGIGIDGAATEIRISDPEKPK
jgi:hypothetical protein